MGDAGDAAALLLTDDPAEADRLAERLEGTNEDRRDLTKTAVAEARAALPAETGEPAIVIRGPWPAGSWVSSRRVLPTNRGLPAVVGSEIGDDGSRLVPQRRPPRPRGHPARLRRPPAPSRRSSWSGGPRGRSPTAGTPFASVSWPWPRPRHPRSRGELAVDLALPALEVDYDLHPRLAKLAPWGVGNPEPLVAVLGLTATRVRDARGGHSQLVILRRTRRARRDRVRLAGPRHAGRRGRSGRRGRATDDAAVRRRRIAATRHPRRRVGRIAGAASCRHDPGHRGREESRSPWARACSHRFGSEGGGAPEDVLHAVFDPRQRRRRVSRLARPSSQACLGGDGGRRAHGRGRDQPPGRGAAVRTRWRWWRRRQRRTGYAHRRHRTSSSSIRAPRCRARSPT